MSVRAGMSTTVAGETVRGMVRVCETGDLVGLLGWVRSGTGWCYKLRSLGD